MTSRSWCALLLPALSLAADPTLTDLRPETLREFEHYAAAREQSIERQRLQGPQFLWSGESPERFERVKRGEIVIGPVTGSGVETLDGGLAHDWVAAAFIPGATMERLLRLIRNYDRHAEYYAPEVSSSHLVSADGDHLRVSMRLMKRKIVTVVLDTDHDVRYGQRNPKQRYSRSATTQVREILNPGTAKESALPPGHDHGFLWQLRSYWRFEERDGGVYVECEALSLTRGVPAGLGPLVRPIIRELPRESLERTLAATRNAYLTFERASAASLKTEVSSPVIAANAR